MKMKETTFTNDCDRAVATEPASCSPASSLLAEQCPLTSRPGPEPLILYDPWRLQTHTRTHTVDAPLLLEEAFIQINGLEGLTDAKNRTKTLKLPVSTKAQSHTHIK